jgi:hypothetical protein
MPPPPWVASSWLEDKPLAPSSPSYHLASRRGAPPGWFGLGRVNCQRLSVKRQAPYQGKRLVYGNNFSSLSFLLLLSGKMVQPSVSESLFKMLISQYQVSVYSTLLLCLLTMCNTSKVNILNLTIIMICK